MHFFSITSQISHWPEAFHSFGSFCNTPVNTIMTVPPGVQFDAASYIATICSVDIEELAKDFSEILSGNQNVCILWLVIELIIFIYSIGLKQRLTS